MKEEHGRPRKQQERKQREFNSDDNNSNSNNNIAWSEKMDRHVL